jgi:hypothetical protein
VIKAIAATLPRWARVLDDGVGWLKVEVAPPHQSGAPGDRFVLLITDDAPAATVREAGLGSRLPAMCPERHINGDGSFCLGLNRPAIKNCSDASSFWLTLRTYLLSQQFAEKHGRWPPGRGLSHGDAAHIQIKAEQAARRCGLEMEYAAALDHQAGWLAGPLPSLIYQTETRKDHVCPHSANDPGNPLILRSGCRHCDALAELITMEFARREAEAEFTKSARLQLTCCKSMLRCSLRSPLEQGG